MHLIRRGAAFVAAAAMVAALLPVAGVQAQMYPAPEGACVLVISDPTPPLNTTITVEVQTSDGEGNPVSMDGEASITEQPGTTATISPTTFTTNEEGIATLELYTGDTPGVIRISAICDGEVTTAITTGDAPAPPPTGFGPADSGTTGASTATLAALGAAGLLTVTAGAALFRRRVTDR